MAATILIVEAEAAVRRLLQVALSGAGYAVKAASGADAAMEICRETGVELVLADVGLSMDGHALARRVAVECPGTRVLLMVGWEKGCEDCPYSPRCHVITKPFRMDRLLEVAAAALSERPGRQVD